MPELRPSATSERTGSGERELPYDPVEWFRRLDQARQAREEILAAREAGRRPQRGEAPYRLPEAVGAPRGPTRRATGPAAAAAEPSARAGAVRRRFRAVAGFALGIAVGTMLVFLLLFGLWDPAGGGPTDSEPAQVGAAAAE